MTILHSPINSYLLKMPQFSVLFMLHKPLKKLNLRIFQTLRGHTGSITAMSTDPEGKKLYTVSADANVRYWDIRTGKALLAFEAHGGPILSMSVNHRDQSHTTLSLKKGGSKSMIKGGGFVKL